MVDSFDLKDHNKRPDILWKRGKPKIEQYKIHFGVLWRRFDTQTKGQGLVMVLFLGGFVLLNLFGWIGGILSTYYNQQHYSNALKTFCTDKQFYSWNYKVCEDIGVRPSGK